MKTVAIATVLAVLGLGISVLWADTPAPTTAPENSRLVRHFQKIGLNLTAQQITKINDIEKARHTAARAVLTADQQKILADAKGKGHDAMKAAWQEVRKTLTDGQKTKLQELRKASWLEVKAVLTPDQLAKLKACEHHKGTSQPAPTPVPAPTT
jgi:Spy/CpxP family protein refolding chaperone